MKNWNRNGVKWQRTYNVQNDSQYKGTWLVIDEFNRADIDKAMGQPFTALETKRLKVPTSDPSKAYEEVPIPKDYRIIGTLNTADKHYLFKLSDALKRRFAYIEIKPPLDVDEQRREQYYAIRNAIKELSIEDPASRIIKLNIDLKEIDLENSNKDFIRALDTALDFLNFIKSVKILGTAILKSIYQTLLTAHLADQNPLIMLQSAINANIIPQLENVPRTTLETIRAFCFDEAHTFFNTIYANGEAKRYQNDFSFFLRYIGSKNPEDKLEKFINGRTDPAIWAAIKNDYDTKKVSLQMPLLKKSLGDLIETSDFI